MELRRNVDGTFLVMDTLGLDFLCLDDDDAIDLLIGRR